MIALNLQLPKFQIESAYKLLKRILTVRHQLECNFLGQRLRNKFVLLFVVLKQNNEDLRLAFRDLNQVN